MVTSLSSSAVYCGFEQLYGQHICICCFSSRTHDLHQRCGFHIKLCWFRLTIPWRLSVITLTWNTCLPSVGFAFLYLSFLCGGPFSFLYSWHLYCISFSDYRIYLFDIITLSTNYLIFMWGLLMSDCFYVVFLSGLWFVVCFLYFVSYVFLNIILCLWYFLKEHIGSTKHRMKCFIPV